MKYELLRYRYGKNKKKQDKKILLRNDRKKLLYESKSYQKWISAYEI